jgi:hypothetical protein
MDQFRSQNGHEVGPLIRETIKQLVVPLAGLICATDDPQAMLTQVSDAFRNEVRELNDLASACLNTFPGHYLG